MFYTSLTFLLRIPFDLAALPTTHQPRQLQTGLHPRTYPPYIPRAASRARTAQGPHPRPPLRPHGTTSRLHPSPHPFPYTSLPRLCLGQPFRPHGSGVWQQGQIDPPPNRLFWLPSARPHRVAIGQPHPRLRPYRCSVARPSHREQRHRLRGEYPTRQPQHNLSYAHRLWLS